MSWSTSTSATGAYVRKESPYRNFIERAEGARFPPAAGRYVLYVSYACPWANRTLIVRALKGLQSVIEVVVVDHFLGEGGWRFPANLEDVPGATPDHVNNARFLREVYLRSNPEHDTNVTVPVLWDKETNTIVSNESSEILRMLTTEFDEFAADPELDLYPEALRPAIDAVNEWVYPGINNGVYRCGFAVTQEAYDEAFDVLFAALDRAEELLGRQRYLAGDQLTEADVRLFVTLIRFDAVYVQHFKCNLRRIADYPNLLAHTREVYQLPGVAETVNFDHIKLHYCGSHKNINPLGIVPRGPQLPDYMAPHGRSS